MIPEDAKKIEEKRGLAPGVASNSYLMGLQKADSLCQERWGWYQSNRRNKKGRKLCERRPKARQETQPSVQTGEVNKQSLSRGLLGLGIGVGLGVVGAGLISKSYVDAKEKAWQSNYEAKDAAVKENFEKKEALYREEIARNEGERVAAEKKIEEYQQNLTDAQENLASTKKEVGDLSKLVKTLESDKKGLEGDIQKLEKEKSTLKNSETSAEAVAEKDQKIQQLTDQLSQKEKSLTATNTELQEQQDLVQGLTKAVSQFQGDLGDEKAKYKQLAESISSSNKDLKSLQTQVDRWKSDSRRAEQLHQKLVTSEAKVAELEVSNRGLGRSLSELGESIESLKQERSQAQRELGEFRSAANAESEEGKVRMKELQRNVDEAERKISAMEKAEVKSRAAFEASEKQLIAANKKTNTLQAKVLDLEKTALENTKLATEDRDKLQKQLDAENKKHRSEMAELAEKQAETLRQSPETFSQNKMRRSKQSDLKKVLSYSINGGIDSKELDDPSSSFWQARDQFREKATVAAYERIGELEEQRIQAAVASKMATAFRETPLAMSELPSTKQIANMRKIRSNFAESSELARAIADPTTVIPKPKNKAQQTQMTEWRSIDSAMWSLQDEDSPTFRLLENEGLISEAKLRDVFVFSESRKIRAEAQAEALKTLKGRGSQTEKAAELKEIHKLMTQSIAEMEREALGSQEDLFKAIRRKLEGRKDSLAQKKHRLDAKNSGRRSVDTILLKFSAKA